MNTYNNEIEIIKHFQSLNTESILLIPEDADTENILDLILNIKK